MLNSAVSSTISPLLQELLADRGGIEDFIIRSSYARRSGEAGICDFVFGNPHDLPLAEFEEAIRRHSQAQAPDWFAYKMSEPESRAAVAESLEIRYGISFHPADIAMTNGAFAGLAVTLRAIAGPGDEVVFFSPPWFSYTALIRASGATPVRVKLVPPDFDLDLETLRAAITPKTRAVILNTPQNPTGRIYGPETLEGVASLLDEASESAGRPVYLISDEAYSRIVFDDAPFYTPAAFYPRTFLIYTYGKTLLTPGERIGYVAMPPTMPERPVLRSALMQAQIITGWAFPNATLQRAIKDLEAISVDIKQLQSRRDRMLEGLRGAGYEVGVPEGTFYMLPKSPIADDVAFTEVLASQDIFVLPGALVELPGYFRISLTASDEMVERSLPGFAAAMDQASS